MKRIGILILIITLLISNSAALGEEDMIWDYDKDQFLKDLMEGKSKRITIIAQKELDKELSEALDIDLLYTNLKDCLETAVYNNYNVKIRRSQKNVNCWEFRNSQAQFLPDFTYNFNIEGLSGTYLVGGIVSDNVREIPISNTFQVLWSIDQGKKFFRFAERKNLLKSSCANLQFTREEIIKETAIRYYRLLGLKLNLEVLKANLVDRHEQFRLTSARHQIGEGAKFDVVRAEAQEAQARQEYISAFNNLRLQQARLANVMGIEVLNAIYPTETTSKSRELIDQKHSVKKLYKIALKSRDDIIAKRKEIEAIKAQRSSFYVDFAPDLQLSYEHAIVGTTEQGLFPNNTLGARVVIPLGDKLGLGTYTKIKAFNARIKAAKFELINLQRQVKENIINSYYTSKTALERIKAAKVEVRAADESLKISLVRLSVGQSTFIDVLQAQALKVEARQRLIAATIDYNIAQVQLLFDAGIISVDGVLNNYAIPEISP